MLDAHVGDGNLDDSLSDSGDPVVTAKCGQALRYGFVEGGRGDFNGVADAFEVLDGDMAGAESHGEDASIFAFYSP